jgi:hypothetical protein
MKRIIVCILLLTGSAFAQADKAQMEQFKKEAGPLRSAVEDAVNAVVTGQRAILEGPQVTYLDGYGAVVSVEVQLEPVFNPFAGQKTPAEIKTIVAQRRKDLQQKLEGVLKQRVGAMESVGTGESVTIVVYLFTGANKVDLPNLPSQLIFTAKKQDPVPKENSTKQDLVVTLKEF